MGSPENGGPSDWRGKLAEDIASVERNTVATLRKIVDNARSLSRTSTAHESKQLREEEQLQQDDNMIEKWLEIALQQVVEFENDLPGYIALPVVEVLAASEMGKEGEAENEVLMIEKNAMEHIDMDVAPDIGGPCMYPTQAVQDGFTFKYLQREYFKDAITSSPFLFLKQRLSARDLQRVLAAKKENKPFFWICGQKDISKALEISFLYRRFRIVTVRAENFEHAFDVNLYLLSSWQNRCWELYTLSSSVISVDMAVKLPTLPPLERESDERAILRHLGRDAAASLLSCPEDMYSEANKSFVKGLDSLEMDAGEHIERIVANLRGDKATPFPWNARRCVIRAIEELGETRNLGDYQEDYAALLVEEAKSQNSRVREAAIKGLGAMGQVAASYAGSISSCLGDDNKAVRQQTLKTVHSLACKYPEVMDKLKITSALSLLSRVPLESEVLDGCCVHMIAHLVNDGPTRSPEISNLISHQNSDLKYRILTCLAVVGTKYAHPYIEEISNRLEDKEEISVIVALECIHNFHELQENIWQRIGRCLDVDNEAKCLGALQVVKKFSSSVSIDTKIRVAALIKQTAGPLGGTPIIVKRAKEVVSSFEDLSPIFTKIISQFENNHHTWTGLDAYYRSAFEGLLVLQNQYFAVHEISFITAEMAKCHGGIRSNTVKAIINWIVRKDVADGMTACFNHCFTADKPRFSDHDWERSRSQSEMHASCDAEVLTSSNGPTESSISTGLTTETAGSNFDSYIPLTLKLILLKVIAGLSHPRQWGLGPDDILRMACYVIKEFREVAEVLVETLRIIEKYFKDPRPQEYSENFQKVTLELIHDGPETVRMEAIRIAIIISRECYLESTNSNESKASHIFESLKDCMTHDESPIVRKEAGIALGSLCFSPHLQKLFQIALERLNGGGTDSRASAATEICTYFEGMRHFNSSLCAEFERIDSPSLRKEHFADKTTIYRLSEKKKGKAKMGHCEARTIQAEHGWQRLLRVGGDLLACLSRVDTLTEFLVERVRDSLRLMSESNALTIMKICRSLNSTILDTIRVQLVIIYSLQVHCTKDQEGVEAIRGLGINAQSVAKRWATLMNTLIEIVVNESDINFRSLALETIIHTTQDISEVTPVVKDSPQTASEACMELTRVFQSVKTLILSVLSEPHVLMKCAINAFQLVKTTPEEYERVLSRFRERSVFLNITASIADDSHSSTVSIMNNGDSISDLGRFNEFAALRRTRLRRFCDNPEVLQNRDIRVNSYRRSGYMMERAYYRQKRQRTDPLNPREKTESTIRSSRGGTEETIHYMRKWCLGLVFKRLTSTSMHLDFLKLDNVHQHRIASENRLRASQEPIAVDDGFNVLLGG